MKLQEGFPRFFNYRNGIYLLICFGPFLAIIFKSLLKETSHNIAIVTFLNSILLYGLFWGLDFLAQFIYRKVPAFQTWYCLERKNMMAKLVMAMVPFVLPAVLFPYVSLMWGQIVYMSMSKLGFSEWTAWAFLLSMDFAYVGYAISAVAGLTLLQVSFVGGLRLYYQSRIKR